MTGALMGEETKKGMQLRAVLMVIPIVLDSLAMRDGMVPEDNQVNGTVSISSKDSPIDIFHPDIKGTRITSLGHNKVSANTKKLEDLDQMLKVASITGATTITVPKIGTVVEWAAVVVITVDVTR